MSAPGRNEPCPCGSGRKYKRCCGTGSARGKGSAETGRSQGTGATPGGFGTAQTRTDDERRLIEKLLRIEALHARPGTAGEKAAAASAAERMRARLQQFAQIDPPVEYRFSVNDEWSRRLLMALLRRYGVEPYRYARQRHTTVMARVSQRFVDETLWPEFIELDETLQSYLRDVTERVIAQAIHPDTRDEEVRPDAAVQPGSDGPGFLPPGRPANRG